jgi:hypothetical protein
MDKRLRGGLGTDEEHDLPILEFAFVIDASIRTYYEEGSDMR